MLSRARSLSRDEAETQEADVGKSDAGVSVHPPVMRQAVAWELAMRNIRQSEVGLLFHIRQTSAEHCMPMRLLMMHPALLEHLCVHMVEQQSIKHTIYMVSC